MIDKSYLKDLISNPSNIKELECDTIEHILKSAIGIFNKDHIIKEIYFEGSNDLYAIVVGDIHGNLTSLMQIITLIEKLAPKYVIFLGDVVDRGAHQLECLIVVLALKILHPDSYILLRGNHETLEMNEAYGFYQEFLNNFINPQKFRIITTLYSVLPICAVVNDSIFCVHGGIPYDSKSIDCMKSVKSLNFEGKKLLEKAIFEMLWNDPKENLSGFSASYRGSGIQFFGKDVFQNFMRYNNFEYLIRSHECFNEGFRWFFDKKLLSIFSSEGYNSYNFASIALIYSKQVIPKLIQTL
jgi:diadenosine tetraphosphatase ApaH/serine/threonine PP2A family protein phosphatase